MKGSFVTYFKVNVFQSPNPPPSFKGGIGSGKMAQCAKALATSLTI